MQERVTWDRRALPGVGGRYMGQEGIIWCRWALPRCRRELPDAGESYLGQEGVTWCRRAIHGTAQEGVIWGGRTFFCRTFRLIVPQNKRGNMHPCTAKIWLKKGTIEGAGDKTLEQGHYLGAEFANLGQWQILRADNITVVHEQGVLLWVTLGQSFI
jgi:hypothetical protein